MARVGIRKSWLLRPVAATALAGMLLLAWGPQGRAPILGHALPVGLVAIFLGLAYAVGMKLLRGLRLYENDLYPIGMERRGEHWAPAPEEEERQWREQHETLVREYWSWEKACFALGLGLGVLAYGTLVLSLIHQLNLVGVLIGLALAALCVPGEITRVYRWAQLPRDWQRRGENSKRGLRASLRTVFWILIAIPVAMSFLSALAPPHQSDALRYHLAVPAVYVQQGGWVFLPDNAFSNFPFAIEMLYALALVFGQDVSCRLLHWVFFVLTLLTLYAFSKRLQSSSAGLMAAATLACTPFVPILSSWAFIEMGMTFYFLLTFQCLGLWLESLYRKGGKKGWLGAYQLELRPERLAVLGGVFCGLAMSVKYTALFLFVFGLGTIGWGIYRRKKLTSQLDALDETRREKAFLHSADARQGIYFGLSAAIVFLPWTIKNWIATGNPLFPFLNSIFKSPYWSPFEAAFYAFHAGQKGAMGAGQGWLSHGIDWISLPWRATVEHFGGWQIGPVFLVYTALLLVFVKRWPRALWYFAGGALFFFVVWAGTYRDNRFLLPVLALLALLIGHALGWMWHQPNRRVEVLVHGLALLLAVNCGGMFFNWTGDMNPFPVVAGKIGREDFLRQRLDYLPAMEFLNHLPTSLEGAKVLMVGEYRPYYCRRAYLANDWFNQPVLLRLLKESGTVPALAERLKNLGVKYVLLNELELSKGGYELFFNFHFLPDAEARAALEAMKTGRLPVEAFNERVMQSPLYRQYREFLYSGEYLRRIYPEGPRLPREVAVYELL